MNENTKFKLACNNSHCLCLLVAQIARLLMRRVTTQSAVPYFAVCLLFFLLGLTCLLCDHLLTLRFDPKACQILSSTNRMEFHIYRRKTRHNKKHLPWDQTSNSRHNQFSLIRLASHGWSSGLLRLDVSVRISSHTFL